MKFLKYGKDGGPESTVWGFWFVEIKSLFSIALLVFENGSREAFHSHAFNSVSWVLKGKLQENLHCVGSYFVIDGYEEHTPSFKPVVTHRDTFHKVNSVGRTYVLTFRGPWAKEWKEYIPKTNEYVTLQDGRKIKK